MASGASSRDKVTIKIPRSLYQRLRAIVQDSGFDSVTDFVVYVLRDLVAAQAREEGDSTPLTAQEIQAIRQRLRNLGYL
jgi:Arc/MetJ-type ribon-helix-helix transcriptional regulator